MTEAAVPMDEQGLPSLGSWGTGGGSPAPGEGPEYATVTYYGRAIRVVLDPLSLELAFEEFMDMATEIDSAEDTRAFGAVRKFMRAILHPDDFGVWWRLVRTNRQDIMEQMEFAKWVVEQQSGHPTEQRSTSAGGPLPTTPNSGAELSSRVQHRLESQGRPDLALVVLRKAEADAQQG